MSEGTFENDNTSQKVLFLKPTTFMNLAGQSVQKICAFYNIPSSHILLIADDKDLPFGVVRYREKGSSGGHNGLKDIFRVLGTENIARIKIGVHTDFSERFENTADFVLSSFTEMEMESLEKEIFLAGESKILEFFKNE